MALGTDPVQVGQSGPTTLAYLQWGQEDPTVIATAGTPGSLFLRIPTAGMPASAIGLYQKTLTDDADTNWQLIAGGGISGMAVEDEGVPVVGSFTTFNFVGAGVTATDAGGGVADITIPGVGGAGDEREDFVLTAPDIAAGFIDLAFLASHDSVVANLEGAALLIEGAARDYTLSDLAVTRLTFDPTLIPFLVVGQLLQVQYVH